jgi:hypothetical protein
MASMRCRQATWRLRRADRDYIGWPVTGVPLDAQALVSLEGGAWTALVVGTDVVTGYFAGPDFVNPAPALVVPATSHVEMRIITGGVSVTFDGGYIQLVT